MSRGASIGRGVRALALGLAIGALAAPAAANASVGSFAMALQPDGKILAAGGSGRIGGVASGKEFGAVVRYLPDGALDRSFGGGDGVALIRRMLPFTAIALQPDGRIVLAAPSGGNAGVARLLPDGHLDGNFGFSGLIAPGASSSWYPTSVAVAPDGAIFVGGMTGYLNDPGEHWYGRLYRVESSGMEGAWVGSMTSGDGRPGEPKTFLNDFLFGPGGSVVGAGTAAAREPTAKSQAALARLLPGPQGAGGYPAGPDPGFGAGAGLVAPSFFPASPAPEAANALSWDKRRLVIAGQANDDLLLARYSRGGILDARFGRRGAVVTGVRRADRANAVAVRRSGEILAAGASAYGCGGELCEGLLLARYKGNGRLDRSFGSKGVVSPRVETKVYGTPATEVAYEVAGRSEGRVLVGGLVSGPGSSRFFLRRYLADGGADTSFGSRGRLTTLPLVAGTPAPGSGM